MFAGAFIYLLGGLAVDRRINRRISTCESEIDHIEGRLTQEIKRRASQMGNEARADKKTLYQEARSRLESHGQSDAFPVDPVFKQ